MTLHRNYAHGSDDRLGNDLIKVKTIIPFKGNDRIVLNMVRNFSKVLMVKINREFEVSSRLIARKSLPGERN